MPKIIQKRVGWGKCLTLSANLWVWTTAIDIEFQMKATYEVIRRRKQTGQWPWTVWFENNIPKHAVIAWLEIVEGLKTLDKLFAWGVVSSRCCVICNRGMKQNNTC